MANTADSNMKLKQNKINKRVNSFGNPNAPATGAAKIIMPKAHNSTAK